MLEATFCHSVINRHTPENKRKLITRNKNIYVNSELLDLLLKILFEAIICTRIPLSLVPLKAPFCLNTFLNSENTKEEKEKKVRGKGER